jgi:hypothetical protein
MIVGLLFWQTKDSARFWNYMRRSIKYWEIVADNLSKAEWSLGCVSAVDSRGRTIWIADAHRDDGKRFVVHADERLTAFVELEAVTRASCKAICQSVE